jgi:peptidyl-tRNA hydrolase
MRLGEMFQMIVIRDDIESEIGYSMPAGMMAAQCVHSAVLALANELVTIQDPIEVMKVVQEYATEVPTVINLRVRDDAEMQHVFNLFNKKCVAENKFIPFGEMFDTNPNFFGYEEDGNTLRRVRTAIAMGPAAKEEF